MDERSLHETVRRIEERLSRLERAMAPPPPPPLPPTTQFTQSSPTHPPNPPPAVGPIEMRTDADAAAKVPSFESSVAPRFEVRKSSPVDPERFVGGRIFAWIGAIIVMIGVGVFVKYAYDQQWFGRLGGAGRFVLATIGALALIVLGEVALRRLGRAAAAGLFAAGIGALFVIAAAGTMPEVMKVYGPGGAAAYSVGAAMLGVFIARRSSLLAVGVVVVIGVYVVPLLAGVMRMESALAAPGYLTVVLVMSLVLASVAREQRPIRIVAFVCHCALALLFLTQDQTPRLWKEGFVALWWAMFVVDAIVASVRSLPAMEDDASSSTGPMIDRSMAGRSHFADGAVVVIATMASVLAAFFFAGAWSGWRDPWAWLPVGEAVFCIAAAAQLHALRGTRGDAPAIDSVIVALVISSAGLIASALAILLEPEAACVGWAAMGLAAVAFAARSGSRGVACIGVLVLVPACAVAAWSALEPLMGAAVSAAEWPIPGLSRSAIVFSSGWWLPAMVALAAFGAVAMLRALPARGVRFGASVIATIAWIVTSFVVSRGGSGLLVATLLPLAWLLHSWRSSDRFERRAALVTAALFAFAAALPSLVDGFAGSIGSAPRSIALLLALGIMFAVSGMPMPHERGGDSSVEGEGPLFGSRSDARSPAVWVIAAVLLALVAIGEAMRGAPSTSLDRAAWVEVATVAAAVAMVALILAAITAGMRHAPAPVIGAESGRPSLQGAESNGGSPPAIDARTGLALWAAFAWLWAAVVLAIPRHAESVPPMSNAMNATAAVVLGALGVSLWFRRSALAACGIAAIVLVAGSWDLVRLAPLMAGTVAEASTLRQSLLSAWWAAVGVGAVVSGFSWRIAALRWAALGLLGATAAKVVFIDLQHAATLARVAALLVVGLLLVGTSIVYARAERRLRGEGASS